MLIHEYQDKWSSDFEEIKEVLLARLSATEVTVEHVGSTAVPGLAAKPIIDVDVVYFSSGDFDKIKSGLEGIGYFHHGNQGILQREVFKRTKRDLHPVLDFVIHHLYVCPSGSEELRRHLFFRDYLRKDLAAREEYQALKQQIAEEAEQDRKRYSEIKEVKARAFILSAIEKAQQQSMKLGQLRLDH